MFCLGTVFPKTRTAMDQATYVWRTYYSLTLTYSDTPCDTIAALLPMTVTSWRSMPVWNSWRWAVSREVPSPLRNALRWWFWYNF